MRALPLLSVLIPLLLAASGALAAARVTLKSSAMVTGARITLADIASVQGDGAAALAALDLGAAPLPGYSARISRAELERTLRSRALPYQLGGDSAASVSIERRAQGVDAQALAALAEEHLRRHLGANHSRVELKLATPLAELQRPAGKVELTARALAPGLVPRRRMQVWVDIAVDGVFARAVALPFDVHAWRPLLAAARELPAGTVPDCTMLVTRDEDVTALDGAAATTDCGAVRGRLKRALMPGAPLLAAYLQASFAVGQGDSIGLQMHHGAIVLESRATALSDGNVGQRIEVRPAGASGTVRAEVIGPALVKIY
ncbi:flagellar basal body P-ring formation protein FlgA [Massilia sp. CCM 8733]|uniref:Flagellar basal body P-ring formation protein FlgA n=1 Tax=Massilia mucilaginosa TaxID=2609282 RepID=A0ABX0NT33_9BURK|nr:flagellar basal body P-ring formation chaperone FlgA [Massilia mucilaginosa]NHZ89950.1 flagellar basal body P-ring formation protein FlgA [Massilia mucilaginosa]